MRRQGSQLPDSHRRHIERKPGSPVNRLIPSERAGSPVRSEEYAAITVSEPEVKPEPEHAKRVMLGGGYMDEYTKDPSEWRMSSECMFSGAMTLFQSKNFLEWFPAAILGHLALEQLLKSAAIQAGCPVTKGRPQEGRVWGHNLVALAQLLASKRRDFPADRLKEDLAVFDAYHDELRYPQAVERVRELGAEEGTQLSCLMEIIRLFAAPLPAQWRDEVPP
jgi:hypothetical protein